MIEQWRWINGFVGIYTVSDFGGIYSVRSSRQLRPHKDADGYLRIGLWDGQRQRKFAVHKLVADAFLAHHENALHCEVAHLDNDRANPRAANLKWVSKVENHSHKRLHGTHQAGELHPRAKLTEENVLAIRRARISYGELAERYGVSWRTISDIKRGLRWRHLLVDHG